MAKKNNTIHDNFESLYLLESRLKTSITKGSVEYLNKAETQKVINYSIKIALRKYGVMMPYYGLEPEDIKSVAQSLTMIFYEKYSHAHGSEENKYRILMGFLGQKINNFMRLTKRKHDGKVYSGVNNETNPYEFSIFTANDSLYLEYNNERKDIAERLEEKVSKMTPAQLRKLKKLITSSNESSDQNLIDLAKCIYVKKKLSLTK